MKIEKLRKDILWLSGSLKDVEDNYISLKEDKVETLITTSHYDFRVCWTSDGIRRYYHTFGHMDKPDDWEVSNLIQFIDYETTHKHPLAIWVEDVKGRDIIKKALLDYIETGQITKAPLPVQLTYCNGCFLKSCHTELLNHIASVEACESIFKDFKLKSARKHRNVSIDILMKESRNAAGDHADYFDYVMLSWGNCGAGHRLVNERRLGRGPSDEALESDFEAGITFYFDTDLIFNHKDYVDDGYHAGKIKNELDLSLMKLMVIPESARDRLEGLIPDTMKDKVYYLRDKSYHSYCEKSYELAKGTK